MKRNSIITLSMSLLVISVLAYFLGAHFKEIKGTIVVYAAISTLGFSALLFVRSARFLLSEFLSQKNGVWQFEVKTGDQQTIRADKAAFSVNTGFVYLYKGDTVVTVSYEKIMSVAKVNGMMRKQISVVSFLNEVKVD